MHKHREYQRIRESASERKRRVNRFYNTSGLIVSTLWVWDI